MGNKVIAKVVLGEDEYQFMYDNLPVNKICPVCHSWLGVREINPNFIPSRKKACIRHTYDGFTFVSEEFRQFCIDNQYSSLDFFSFPKSPGYYSFYPKMVYPLDLVRRKVELLKHCPVCGNYEEIIGATPAFTQSGFVLPSNDFILRTSIEFGTREQKDFLIVAGLETMKKMKEAKLHGLFFKDVYE